MTKRAGVAAAIAAATLVGGLVACAPHEKPVAVTRLKIAMPTIGCIGVLPFASLVDDPNAGQQMADLVSVQLMQSDRYFVLDRSEATRLLAVRGIRLPSTSDGPTARMIGSALNLDAVLVGTVTEYGYDPRAKGAVAPAVGATVRLVEVATGRELWLASAVREEPAREHPSDEPVFVSAQGVAADLSQALIDASGKKPDFETKPCWGPRISLAKAWLGTKSAPFDMPPPTPEPIVVAATPKPIATPPPKPLSPSQATLLGSLHAGGKLVLTGVDFKPNSGTLTSANPAVLTDWGVVLGAHPEIHLKIDAFVDPQDKDAAAVSTSRAEAVVAAMVQAGAPASSLTPAGRGGDNPIAPSFAEALRKKNRRVEIEVLAGPK